MNDKRYCGTKDVCYYKNHYESYECTVYDTPKKLIWKTCRYKWKPKDTEDKESIYVK